MRSNFRITKFVRGEFRFQDLPAYTQQQLVSCPSAGGGVHLWIYHVACLLRKAKFSPAAAIELVELATDACDRVVPRREIADAVASAGIGDGEEMVTETERERSARARSRSIGKNYALIERIARAGRGLAGLSKNNPVAPDDVAPEEVLPLLFPGEALICCGRDKDKFQTQPLGSWLATNLERVPFVVPSPMSAVTGLTRDGKPSQRCLDNTGPRRFLVIEFDFKEKTARGEDTPDAPLLKALAKDGISVADLGVALHAHLAEWGNLVMIVHSGGKSEHGWYYVVGQPPEKIDKFMAYAKSLGADPATAVPCQLVRMPGALREGTSTKQVVRFFEPERINQ